MRWLLAFSIAVLLMLILALRQPPKSGDHKPVQESWPGKSWPKSSPAAEGMDEKKLSELAEFLGGAGCVTRDGRLVYNWGSYTGAADFASAAKPVQTLLLLRAVAAGKLPSLEAKVVEWEPGLQALNAALGNKDRSITWHHLLSQTSCYGVTETPGTAFDYNDFQTALLFDTMASKVFGVGPDQVTQQILTPWLTGPLQCQDRPSYTLPEDDLPLGRLKISPRDFCRIGLLVMRGGKWRDQQLIDPAKLRHTLSDPLPPNLPRTLEQSAEMLPGQRTIGGDKNQEEHWGSYTWMWWLNGTNQSGVRLWPNAPLDAYGAFGYGGSRSMVILPSAGIVAAWTKTRLPRTAMYASGRGNMDYCLNLLAASLKSNPTVTSKVGSN